MLPQTIITKKLLWPILAIMYQYLCLVWVVVTGVTFDLVTCAAVTCTAVTSASDCYSNKLTYHWMTHSHMTLQHIDTYATVCHISTLTHMPLSVTLILLICATECHVSTCDVYNRMAHYTFQCHNRLIFCLTLVMLQPQIHLLLRKSKRKKTNQKKRLSKYFVSKKKLHQNLVKKSWAL